MREHFWGTHPELLDLVSHLSDSELKKLRLGGHDPAKVYAGFAAAVNRGAALARGQVLVLLNNDTIVPGNALDRLVDRRAAVQ